MPTHVEHVMGMAVGIDLRGASSRTGAAIVPAVVRWLHWVDATFSTYKESSVVSRIDRGELGIGDAPAVVQAVLRRCDEFRDATDGYFDPWIDGRLDPSGLVKGWAVEVASGVLVQCGVADHAINAGGDVRARGGPEPGRPWRAAVAHPLVAGALCAVVDVGDGAIATSGLAERGAHVVDPHTGRAALDLASVTVVGPDLISTDVYATAALAMGLAAPRWLAGLAGYDSLVVDADGHMWTSPGMEARLDRSALAG